MADIRILLTFDDGPHAAVMGNRTDHVLDVLAKDKVIAAFFVQTHARITTGKDHRFE